MHNHLSFLHTLPGLHVTTQLTTERTLASSERRTILKHGGEPMDAQERVSDELGLRPFASREAPTRLDVSIHAGCR